VSALLKSIALLAAIVVLGATVIAACSHPREAEFLPATKAGPWGGADQAPTQAQYVAPRARDAGP
jgi:hypothetical protein